MRLKKIETLVKLGYNVTYDTRGTFLCITLKSYL